MSELAKYPFEGYTLYKVYHRKEGRMMAQLVNGNIHRTTMSYARYLMSVHLGRILGKEEHVDHINNNREDDRVDNFQLLSQAENKEKYHKNNPAVLTEFICPICSSVFLLSKQRSSGKVLPCCSVVCGHKKKSKTRANKKSVAQESVV